MFSTHGCCLGGVGCLAKHRQEMNPGIKLESATSGLNYSSWLFFRLVINDLVAPLTQFLECKCLRYSTMRKKIYGGQDEV